MKKALLFVLLNLFVYSEVKSQNSDSLVYISGRVFNQSSLEYAANTEIWLIQYNSPSYKILTNDTGYFFI